jgi:hypothetical protein
VLLVALGTMLSDGSGFIGLVATDVRSDARTGVKDLYRGQRRGRS